ncbi:MAG: PEP-utilizing enzyme, partial [Desulfovibrio sp.]
RLTELTTAALDLSKSGSLVRALADVEQLAAIHEADGPPSFEGMGRHGLLAFVARQLELCSSLGTLPFSIIARHGFIAESLLRSASARGAIDPQRVLAFKRSISTIMGDLSADMAEVVAGNMSQADFLARYGHLRPGTYDITSPRYADRSELFSGVVPVAVESGHDPFALTKQERASLDGLFAEAGLPCTADVLLRHAEKAIVGREYAKFVFTRSLSDAMEGLAAWAATLDIGRDELSYLTVHDVLDTAVLADHSGVARRLTDLSERRRSEANLTGAVKLSYLIRGVRDLHVVPIHRSQPNFITNDRIRAKVLVLDSTVDVRAGLMGRIACIENADPGFDWIFTKGICGLVTKYGGANSHMAIRCAELGLPAAIGCGEQLFDRVSGAVEVELNCGEKILRPANDVR